MKKINFLLLFFFSISLFVFNSCDSSDQDPSTHTIISAGKYEFDLGVTVNTAGSIDIEIYTNNTSSLDRSFSISIDGSSTGSSSDYTVPASITIPAKANSATLTIDAQDVTNTLVLNIEVTSGTFAAEQIVINIIKLCPVTASTFTGDAVVVADEWADYAPGDVLPVVAGNSLNEFRIIPTAPWIANRATAYMLVTFDPETFTATLTSNVPFDYGVPIQADGTGSVDPCTGIMTMSVNWTRPSDGASYGSNQSLILQF